jgi:hypothetical protein
MPKLFAQDKANHYIYGSQAAWIGALAAMLIFVLARRYGALHGVGLEAMLYTGMIGAVLAAAALGKVTEMWQARMNARALAQGKPAPHNIEAADVRATAAGCIPVVAALGFVVVLMLVL